ncbi:oxidoreductase [Sphingomonas oleivorans]|uniref:NADPH--hemoprotein reductase n=1 Tax=Sphingomonas oleivorans TaxID=1735121 RepID=A0A2T5G210_9SPHN|nr:sulfite reductase subunit alpha [Sphingomonas oleivorans]PTQ13193.1 oxidoreductase [Sphingomonas oleivorans]
MADPLRIGLAIVATSCWLALCVAAFRAHYARRPRPFTLSTDSMPLLLVHASQTGFAEQVAQRTAVTLGDAGIMVQTVSLGELDPTMLTSVDRALFIVSTTGEGDAPDNAASFLATAARPTSLAGLRYALLALGDRRYRHYCAFGHRLDHWLRANGARAEADLIEVDNGDPGALRHWQQGLRLFGADSDMPDWAPPAYQRWRLAGRRLLNSGSLGGEIHHIILEPEDRLPDWAAGDIVELYPGPAADAFAVDGPALPHREYSVASIPADGRIELVVRRMRHPDGRPGLGSGWLCEHAAPGTAIALRIRTNRAFHAPEPSRPMILIGNGSGIAGLRAHLSARPEASRNWLLFGERSALHDRLFADELDRWRESGRLARLDLAFSRDTPDRPYVQHRLLDAADTLRDWVEQGAALYVCGSQEGMAAGVNAALATILGADRLEALGEEGRYRRDVY